MRQARYRFILLPLLFVLAGVTAFAQANSEVTGIVTDQTGAVVAGAKITLTDPATNTVKTTESGGTGLYDFSGLNPGSYNLKVAAKGFEGFAENGVVVNVSQTFRHDVKLTVGVDTQTVTVEADALAVQTDSNVVSTLISSEQISEIATENRNFAALAALGLGVSSALPDSNTPTSVAASFSISVNGLRESHNIWLIDGGEADDRGGAGGMDIMPSQDAIAEFNMLTSNYPPDYGISSGATMSLSLKSGTQKFHGTAYEFNRTPDYDAVQAVANSKTDIHYNIFGGNVGGPVFIPKLYNTNKQKTFFFWNEEWRKILSGAGANVNSTLDNADRPALGSDLTYVVPAFTKSSSNPYGQQLLVPSVASSTYYATKMLNGYQNTSTGQALTPGGCWSGVLDTWDASTSPAYHHCFASSNSDATLVPQVVPHGLFDNNGVLYLNSPAIPRPTNTAIDQVISNVANPIDVVDTVVRIDHKFNDKWAILGHYLEDKVTQGYALPELGWLWASYNSITSTLSNPADSAAIKLSGTINPNLLLEASINYDGNVINITNSAAGNLPSGWQSNPLTPNFAITRNSLPGLGYIGPYSVAEDTGSAPWHNAARDYEPKVDVSYTMGKHAEKFGFSYNRYTKNQQLFGDEQGSYNFGQLTGDSFIDIALGLSTGYNQFQAVPIRHYVNQTPSVYAMDNWHVTPRLSLQLGLRYDALPHAWDRNNQVANFDPSNFVSSEAPIWNGTLISGSTPGLMYLNGAKYYVNGMGLAGQNGFPRGLVSNDYATLQPRVGFSEDLFGSGKTVLRGGLGTFYERLQGNDIYNAATNSPFANNVGLSNTFFSSPGRSWFDGSNTNNPALGVPVFATGVTNLAHTYKAPAVAQFSLGVQHEIRPSMIWVVQYVGNLAWHQNIERDINDYPLSTNINVRCNGGDGSDKYPGDVCPNGTTPSSLSNANLYRQYQGYGEIKQEENTTNSNYNGFQTGLRLQNKWGLSGELDYTHSHEIDLTSSDLTPVSNPFNLKYDKASGNLDRRNIVNANYVYKIPLFNKSQGLLHTVAGGWEIAGTAVDETGIPGTGALNYQGPGMSLSYDPVGLGGNYTNRPNISGTHLAYPKKFGEYFDINQFSAPTPVWLGGGNQGFGNARRDAIVFPRRVNFTTALYKSFAMTERAHIELRFESFNTFNHDEWNNIGTSFNSSNFGKVIGAEDSRVLELGGKFVF